MKIKSITGAEPQRQGEYPIIWALGYDGAAEIEEIEQNHGTYGTVWYHVRNSNGDTIAKLNALHVAQVVYET